MSDLVGNPEDRCSCKAAHISFDFVHSEAVRQEFLQSLPELFTLVAESNPEMAAIVIATMKIAACQKCSHVLDLISSPNQKCFGKIWASSRENLSSGHPTRADTN